MCIRDRHIPFAGSLWLMNAVTVLFIIATQALACLLYTSSLLQVRRHIQRIGNIMFQQMEPCLNGKLVDRPGHTVGTQTVQQVGDRKRL